MIIRMVKMTFHEGNTEKFESLFNSAKDKIAAFPGCVYVELLKGVDSGDSRVYLTRSIWYSSSDLEAYRHSDLFRETWSATKELFSAKAEAWTTTLLAKATSDVSE